MNDLTRDLLAYTAASRYDEGRPPASEPAAVLADVIQNMRSLINDEGARVTYGILPRVAIKPSRLAQLFQNLVGNAVKYRRQEAPFVHVTGVEQDGWCIFSVADNGIGIEPQLMSVAQFTKFFNDDYAATMQLAKDAHIQPAD